MNKTILIFCLTLGSFLNSLASADEDKQKLANQLNVPLEYVNICDLFYEGMDFVYNKMQNVNDSSLNGESRPLQIQNEMEQFFKSKEANLPRYVYDSSSQPDNPLVKEYLDRIRSTSLKNAKSIDMYIDSLGVINLEAKEKLDDSQAQIVYASSCVKLAATLYWMENLLKWMQLKTKK